MAKLKINFVLPGNNHNLIPELKASRHSCVMDDAHAGIISCVLLGAWGQQQTSKLLFSFRGPGVKTAMIGSLYSADDSGAVSLSLDSDLEKTVSIPFTKIKDIILTSADDRFSPAVIHLTEGGQTPAKIVNFTVLFINPQTDKPYDLPLSASDDALADFGNRQMVNCAVGTFTRQQ